LNSRQLAVADLHYSNGKGSCRDAPGVCEGDADTTAWLNAALDAEKPDLVVFSGDQLNGQGSSYESLSVLSKFSKPVIDRKIPWAAVFGNHDSEMAKDRHVQMRALAHMPYSLARAGPADVAGVGNCELGRDAVWG
jgi:metallophosphoesterase superfamily enzyme